MEELHWAGCGVAAGTCKGLDDKEKDDRNQLNGQKVVKCEVAG